MIGTRASLEYDCLYISVRESVSRCDERRVSKLPETTNPSCVRFSKINRPVVLGESFFRPGIVVRIP